MIRCTVGVMAYNEEHNIVRVLRALLKQEEAGCQIEEIIVVASGCTDRTVELAQEIAQDHPIIRVHVQAERAGKAAAINQLITIARGEVIVLVGADTLPDPTALSSLVQPFANPRIGMTGGRPVPLNNPGTFLGFTVQALWHLHHRMALRWPKLGELVAFRNVVRELPTNSATDEVALEALLTAQGYELQYVPDAIVYNYGPQTIEDFLHQRRRIFAGHLHIASTYGYQAASMSPIHLLLLSLESFNRYPNLLFWLIGVALLECVARGMGLLDFLFGMQHHIWRPIFTSKRLQQQQREHQPLTLVALQYRDSSVHISPATLMRTLRDIPRSQGVLFWWDQQNHRVMCQLAIDDTRAMSLEDQISELDTYISGHQRPDHRAMLHYRVVEFA